MVDQGDIIKINLNPTKGHEQAGYRPALVISNNFFNRKTNLVIACPITNTNNRFPLHIELDNRTQTTGVILCEHIKSLDLASRGYKLVEKVPRDILENVLNVVKSEL
ncbi:type II toxin-antitoxin system PemK/MazF family toxin [Finegoldia dalianensis]|uniref:Type II toxin-antitoxin system PemK/MazF family toxin n=1 Tax=Finegoldia dalianensis TaxID=3145239 RepID=A0ABM6HAW6_9FIRM